MEKNNVLKVFWENFLLTELTSCCSPSSGVTVTDNIQFYIRIWKAYRLDVLGELHWSIQLDQRHVVYEVKFTILFKLLVRRIQRCNFVSCTVKIFNAYQFKFSKIFIFIQEISLQNYIYQTTITFPLAQSNPIHSMKHSRF